MSFWSYIFPQQIAVFNSPKNGDILVTESFGKRYLEAGGLMQSGPFLERIWSKGIAKLGLDVSQLHRVLILGLAGGSFARVISKLSPITKIAGVDIDAVMVEAGKDYLGLSSIPNLTIHIGDAKKFVTLATNKMKYDLIFVDLYQGYTIPPFAEKTSFLLQLKKLLSPNGSVIFNRIYFRQYKIPARAFLHQLETIAREVNSTKVYSNLLIQIR